jgi:homeobox domain-containing protein
MSTDMENQVKADHGSAVESPAAMTPNTMDHAPTPASAGFMRNNQTPSPSTSTASNPHSANAQSRRPPRKSTLTQQQKNQKRQRATQDQLAILEIEFNKNPTPTAQVRDRIADEIDMTERSVQIWFQNRYVAAWKAAQLAARARSVD